MKKNKKNNRPKKIPEKSTALMITEETIKSVKFQKWCQFFYDRSNKETYGNATKSALKVYNTKDYHSAGQIGHENLKKLENLRLTIMDMEGFGFADLLKILTSKAMAGEYDDMDKLMVRLGYFEPDPKIVINKNTQNNFNFGTIQEAIAASRKERGLNP